MNETSLNCGPDGTERRSAQRAAMTASILKARAQSLAQVPPADGTEEQLEIVEFTLAHERYALETRHVHEVQSMRELTPLPCTPPFVLGIINVRGRIAAVLDLTQFFDLPQVGLTDGTKVVLIGDDDGHMGLAVDAVNGVRHLPLSALQPPLPTLTGIRADYLRGVTAERVAVLNAAAIRADPRLLVNEDV